MPAPILRNLAEDQKKKSRTTRGGGKGGHAFRDKAMTLTGGGK